MKETIAQFLKVKDFPFTIKDKDGNQIYYECSDGYWIKREYISNGKEIYCENSHGYWTKREFDLNKNMIYFEDSNGTIYDNRPKPVVEMTLQEIADKLGMDVKSIRIKE
jgi:hypothetical protein